MSNIERDRVRASIARALFGSDPEPVFVGRYEISKRIGSGGMSVVYEARDTELSRRVAVKVISPRLSGTGRREEYQQRLLREGEALASINHPNVVSVYDVGTFEGNVFLALELVDGESLHAWLAREPRDWNAVLDVMVPAAEGLAAAHGVGLVHRDVTPRNVVLDPRGRVRVVDFGLVGIPAEGGEAAEPPMSLTQTGAMLGTPPYMAPEQWLSGTIDSRTDQFGYCATLFEALYGCRPFSGDAIDALKAAITSGRVVRPDDSAAPAWLLDIVTRGLSVDPEARHASMQTMLASIDVHRSSLSATTRGEVGLGRLRALLADPGADASEIDRIGLEARAAFDAARSTWPDNERATALRSETLVLLVENEIARRNADAAERLLAEHPDPPADLVDRANALRKLEDEKESRLSKLERIERSVDVNVQNESKFRIVMLGAVSQTLLFLALGAITRAGIYRVGAVEMGVFYAVYTIPHVVAGRLASDVMRANTSNRQFGQFGVVSSAGHAAMFLAAFGLDVDIATAFVFAYVLASSIWMFAAISVDRRAAVLPPVTIAAGIATAMWPGLCFELHALAALFGIGGVAVAMRKRHADPHGLLSE